jgi:hypothetical protein
MTSSLGQYSPVNPWTAPLQGIRRGVAEMNDAAQKIAEGDVSPDNFVALIQAEIMIKANRVTAETASELVGSLLNRKA